MKLVFILAFMIFGTGVIGMITEIDDYRFNRWRRADYSHNVEMIMVYAAMLVLAIMLIGMVVRTGI